MRWSKTLGIGPFYVAEYRGSVFEDTTHAGVSTRLHLKTAICYAGDTQVELVEPLGEDDSIYTDTKHQPPNTFHHVCYWSDDFTADLEYYAARGCPTRTQGRMRGGPQFAYLDGRDQVGSVIEILEYDAGIAGLFNRWRDACHAWDGKDAIVKI